MAIYAYTDADFTILLHGVDLTTAQEIHVTMLQNNCIMIDTTNVTAQSDGDGGCVLLVGLSQEDTQVLLDDIDIETEVNWVDAEGKRPKPAGPVLVEAGKQLLRRILNG